MGTVIDPRKNQRLLDQLAEFGIDARDIIGTASILMKATPTPVVGQAGKVRREFEGWASTDEKDFESETVLQDGIEWAYFRKHGFFVDGHTDETGARVGWPLSIDPDIPVPGKKGVRGSKVRGCLLSSRRATEIWDLMEALERDEAPRRVGLSIEGPVAKRTGADGKTVARVIVTNIAIHTNPINAGAVIGIAQAAKALDAMLRKSMTAGAAAPTYHGGGTAAALIPQSHEGRVVRNQPLPAKVRTSDAIGSSTVGGATMPGEKKTADELKDLFDKLSPEQKEEALRSAGVLEAETEAEKALILNMRKVEDHLRKGLPITLDDGAQRTVDADASGVLKGFQAQVKELADGQSVLAKAIQAVGMLLQQQKPNPEVATRLANIEKALTTGGIRKSVQPGETVQPPSGREGEGEALPGLVVRNSLMKAFRETSDDKRQSQLGGAVVALEAGQSFTRKALADMGVAVIG